MGNPYGLAASLAKPVARGWLPLGHAHAARGLAMRRALLAIVEARAAADLPIPPHKVLAAALGISAGQVTRHLAVLMDDGAYSTRCAGMHTRVEGVRP